MLIIQMYASGGRRVHNLPTPPAAVTDGTADTPQVWSDQARAVWREAAGEHSLVEGRQPAAARRKADGHG